MPQPHMPDIPARERPSLPPHLQPHNIEDHLPPFTIGEQHVEERYMGNGATEHHVHIPFETRLGNRGKVILPLTHYTAQNAHNEIAPLAMEMDKVSSLTGEHEPSPYGEINDKERRVLKWYSERPR